MADEKIRPINEWNPATVIWSELPRDYVAAYMRLQYNLNLPAELQGATFKEMFEKTSDAGKAQLFEKVGLIKAQKRGRQLSDAARTVIEDDLIANAPADKFAAHLENQMGIEVVTVADALEDVTDAAVQHQLMQSIIAKLGFETVLEHITSPENFQNGDNDAELRAAVAEIEPLAREYKRKVLKAAAEDLDDYDGYLVEYAKRNNVPYAGDAPAQELTWEKLEQHLQRTPIRQMNRSFDGGGLDAWV
jgi:hypothetical protein